MTVTVAARPSQDQQHFGLLGHGGLSDLAGVQVHHVRQDQRQHNDQPAATQSRDGPTARAGLPNRTGWRCRPGRRFRRGRSEFPGSRSSAPDSGWPAAAPIRPPAVFSAYRRGGFPRSPRRFLRVEHADGQRQQRPDQNCWDCDQSRGSAEDCGTRSPRTGRNVSLRAPSP